jgi:hypothetical protein
MLASQHHADQHQAGGPGLAVPVVVGPVARKKIITGSDAVGW